ncbi:hypothetical protein BLS_008631 [Venturia inaequalis]|uniref:TauD/TfdA-like domain-containing protein n=1 Tax=Venturia inaequalis TaxID=5025 RepID=A0A8H3U580_VENIN|nr:hypothetical protein BLS_008631 [Venturia inaequalis]KAE9972051.1 hypothetical protein EG327_009609 [Venturia inaequalis]RDI85342.1 hypothetical protein Vi05172_g4838 [Venturia inaequalis]
MLFDIVSPYGLDEHGPYIDIMLSPAYRTALVAEEVEGGTKGLEKTIVETESKTIASAITYEAPNHAMGGAAYVAEPPPDLNTIVPVEEKPFQKVRVDSSVGISLPELTDPALEDPVKTIATRALQIIQSYGVNEHIDNQDFSALFLPIVAGHVKSNAPIKLVLPAFPAKSPNRVDKVLGALPDLGEELALAHLNGMCEAIAEFYGPGAEVHIASDGIVYSDILHVTDEDVWDYGEVLRAIAKEKAFRRIKFMRLWDLLDHAQPQIDGQGDRTYYLIHAACIRRELTLRYGESKYDPSEAIKNDPDTLATYMGYKKFLAGDLAQENWVAAASGKEKKARFAEIAKEMLVRGRMYANAIKESMSDCVRLSIHPSQDKTKLSISLIPQARGNLGYTPWHSCVAVELDGTYRTGHAAEFRDTHDLVYLNGRPHHFRARSELFRWDIDVDFEFLYPCGLIIRPSLSSTPKKRPCACRIPMQKVRALSNTFSPVVCRDFRPVTDEEAFIEKAEEMGGILPWFFGIIEKVRDNGHDNTAGNPAKSNEALPMHFDGTFKMVERTNHETGVVEKARQPPSYQIFTCQATAPKGSGATLFMNSRLFFRYLAAPHSLGSLEARKWDLSSSGYWSSTITDLQLVIPHPVTQAPCLRWNENWNEEKTKFSMMRSCIQPMEKGGGGGDMGFGILERAIEKTLYDRRVTVRFEWEKGDLLVNDNVAMLHTRTGYEGGCAREIWRIHVE